MLPMDFCNVYSDDVREQQRVAIALILADEPMGSLDSRTAAFVFELFQDLVRQQDRSVSHKIEISAGRIDSSHDLGLTYQS